MSDCKHCSTSVDTQAKLSEDNGPPVTDAASYWSLTGALQYLTFSRPDIAYTVQEVCLHMHTLWEPISTLSSESCATSPAPSTTASYFDHPRRRSSWSTLALIGLAVPTQASPLLVMSCS
jgi:hypothetical protein